MFCSGTCVLPLFTSYFSFKIFLYTLHKPGVIDLKFCYWFKRYWFKVFTSWGMSQELHRGMYLSWCLTLFFLWNCSPGGPLGKAVEMAHSSAVNSLQNLGQVTSLWVFSSVKRDSRWCHLPPRWDLKLWLAYFVHRELPAFSHRGAQWPVDLAS